jgi:hypothetical protein
MRHFLPLGLSFPDTQSGHLIGRTLLTRLSRAPGKI